MGRASNAIRRLCLGTVLLLGPVSLASAAPPASCASNFVGSWQITVLATGQTYVGQYQPGGAAIAHCPLCAPGTWTCSGDTITVYVNGITVQHRLSSDRTRLAGGCCVATRIGSVPSAAKRPPPQPLKETPPQEATSTTKHAGVPPQGGLKVAIQKSANCSDITGTGSATPAVTHCKDANRFLKAARVTRKEYPAYSADQYKKAAASARSAGDTTFELTIRREAETPAVPDKSIDNPERSPELREAFTYIKAAEAIEQNDATCAGLTAAADNYFAAGRIFLQAIKIGRPTEEAVKSYEYSKSNEMFRKRDELNELVDEAKRENRCHSTIAAATATLPGDIPNVAGETKERCDKGLAEMARLKAELKKSGNVYRGVCGPLGTLAIELAAHGCVEPGEQSLPGSRACGRTACNETKAKWQTENRSASDIGKGLAAAGCGEVKY